MTTTELWEPTVAVMVWDVESGKLLRRWSVDPGWLLDAAFGDDCKTVLTITKDGTVAWWDAATGKELKCWRLLADLKQNPPEDFPCTDPPVEYSA